VNFGIRIVGAGSRGGTGTVNPNRSGRDALQSDVLGQGQAGHHGLGVLVLIGRVPGGVIGEPRSMQDMLQQHELHANGARRGRPQRGHGQDAGQWDAGDQPAARQRCQTENGTSLIF